MSKPIRLGEVVRDRMTGFAGVAIARTSWLFGCDRITVQPKEVKDGKIVDSQTFDEMQLERTNEPEFEAKMPEDSPTGGPRPEPSRRKDPTRG